MLMPGAGEIETDFLWGNTEMTQRIRRFDWSKTSLGTPGHWSPSLKSVVCLMLANSFPMILWWGPDYVQLYNDPYIPVTGLKHPQRSFGVPGHEGWSEIWHILKPLIDTPFLGGPATWMEDITLVINRNNFVEETHFTISYSPVPDETVLSGIGGVLGTVNEITESVLARRQMETLRDLGKSIPASLSESEVYSRTLEVLANNPHDLPSSSIYRIQDHTAEGAPEALQENILVAAEQRRIVVFPASAERHRMEKGAWDVAPSFYVCVPLRPSGSRMPVAVLVAGLNPYRKFDDSYHNLFQLIADQVSLGLNNVFAYEEERNRSRSLEELDKSKTIFFSNISHEFRTPLTLMLGTIEESLKRSALPAGDHERLQIAHRNALRLLRLVNSLLDFSRIESGRQKAAFALTDIATLTRNLAGNFRSVIEKAGLEFDVEVQTPGEPVYVDRSMWEKVVFNLLSNAFKYTLQGTISVRLSGREHQVLLKIADTGTGIPEKELPHMFDRFHRVENARGRTFEGTGIGLSLTRELVHLHNGDITIQSVEGQGTVVTVTLPTGKDHLPSGQIAGYVEGWDETHSGIYIDEAGALLEPPAFREQDAQGQGKKDTILVVDDNSDMSHLICSVLQKYYHVVSASNGKMALEKIAAGTPDLVLTDIMMPEMDGIQLLKTLRQDRRTARLPVVLLTARAGEESMMEGFETGADDYLVKPFTANELLSRVRAQVSISRKRAEIENRLRGFLMQSPAAIAVLEGPEHVYTLANSRYQQLVARTERQLVGHSVREAFPEAQGQGIFEIFDQVFATGQPYIAHDFPVTLKKDGTEETGYYDFTIHPIKDETGEVTDLLAYAHETTAQVLARRQIEESERMLEAEVNKRTFELKQMNKELESFNYIASHDLQEPLRKIQTFILLLEEHRDDPAAWNKYAGKIKEASQRMSQLIHSVLEYSRLSQNRESVEGVDLNTILEYVKTDYEVIIRETEADIKSDRLPMVEAIPFQMHLLFSNLISNAIKFAGKRPVIRISSAIVTGDKIRVRPEGAPKQKYAELRFADNGIGFEQQYAERIFKLFQRLHAKSEFSGTGVGLSIVARILKNHRGYITAESGKGAGSVFTVWLPLKFDEDEEKRPTRE
jgi:signal transduction histidine kinase